ncbi:diguanylate cyclase domain-containing protein [Curvivirga aplysinae]|uniref:diguanylate cyclase domain-containing protein n=1 Tax=Curvivirga aplysinae TaxID=2529852 RepID=UPI0012BCEFB3|nr:diguanylate cyclase [Curvivirga aplysinae]MTI10327.1 diguanylate cyclase [Curvivirga aplysinae]
MNISTRKNSEDLVIENLIGRGASDILKRVQNPIFVCDKTTILYVNAQAYRVFGFENPSNVVNRPLTDFVEDQFADILMLGLDAFAEETDGIPLKMMEMGGMMLDVKMMVTSIPHDSAELYMVECQDITEFVAASQAARSREERIRSILQTVNEAIVIIDEYGIVQDINGGCENMFGYQKAEAVGKNVSIFMPEPYKTQHSDYMAKYLLTGQSTMFNQLREFSGERKDGEVFPLELSIARVTDRHGRQSFTGIMRDISERKKEQERLTYIAYHDRLTGLPNRALFEENLAQAKARYQRSQKPMGIIFIDLDNFKPINDTMGHDAGDAALIEVANRFKHVMRGADTIARIGGDEFVAIVENLQNPEDVVIIANKVLDSLTTPFTLQGKDFVMGASLGIATLPNDTNDLEKLIDYADQAMYESKKAGRNQYRLYSTLTEVEKNEKQV